ncbi:MAG: nitrous oxide reductase accessory protein NosL, partial [Acidobacteria bacterium]|nr:nitrous oxide reductase accessory protein NosL [Acidobacteriota bacterium]
ANIVRMTVNDFNSKSAIDAQTAFYVFGSKQQTPMGEGAIPFKLKSDAEERMKTALSDDKEVFIQYEEATSKLYILEKRHFVL